MFLLHFKYLSSIFSCGFCAFRKIVVHLLKKLPDLGRVNMVDAECTHGQLRSNRAPADHLGGKRQATRLRGEMKTETRKCRPSFYITTHITEREEQEVVLWQPWSDLNPYPLVGTSIILLWCCEPTPAIWSE